MHLLGRTNVFWPFVLHVDVVDSFCESTAVHSNTLNKNSRTKRMNENEVNPTSLKISRAMKKLSVYIPVQINMEDEYYQKTGRFIAASKVDQRVVHVTFYHRGLYGTPGRKRVYDRVLHEVWNRAGKVESVEYDHGYLSGKITFENCESVTAAQNLFNHTDSFRKEMGLIAQSYRDVVDKQLIQKILKIFFVEYEGRLIHVVSFPTSRAALLARRMYGL